MREDIRTAHQTGNLVSVHLKKDAKVTVQDFLIDFGRSEGGESYEETVAEYYRETKGQSIEAKFEWERANYLPDLSQLTDEEREAFLKRWHGDTDQ